MRYNINNHNPEEIKKIIRNFYFTSRFDKSQWTEGVCPPPVGYAQFAFIIFPKNGYEKDGKEFDGYADRYFKVVQFDHIIEQANGFINSGYNYLISKLKSTEDEFKILGLDNDETYKEWTDEEVLKEQKKQTDIRIKFLEELNKSYVK